ncbi:MAG: aspartate aminotransferase family protein [Dehalococcoidia bacterium]|nr:aspartate aminotransferase family protein [Dehalococcoidia bacterium]
MKLPSTGKSQDQVSSELRDALSGDADWRGGKIWSLVYFAGEDVAAVLKDAYATAFFTNGLGPGAFKSLKKFESEVVSMTAHLLGLPLAAGNMTSGGTESILMAVKTARDWARAEKAITEPEMLLPVSAHPAFEKSAHYLGVKVVPIPVGEDLRADAAAARKAVTPNTVLVVGSAPNYPFGTIDPIPELAALAAEIGVACHVDACLGGYLLPFVERLGYTVRPWNFRVPGVSSISADLHKYGFAARGASAVMYRDAAYRRYQYFATTDWPGGLYGSPTMTGSRPGGAIAAAWAVLNYLGEDGYTRLARVIMETTQALKDGINAIPGLRVLGEPDMSVFAFASDSVDIYAVGDALDALGWHPDRQQLPPSLHLMVTPAHKDIVGPFLADLQTAVASVQSEGPAAGGSAAMYGMLDKVPDRGIVRNVIMDYIDRMTKEEAS